MIVGPTSALLHAFHAVLHHLEKLTILSHKPWSSIPESRRDRKTITKELI